MRLISTPGLALAPLRGRLLYPGHSLTVIAKATLALEHGKTAHLKTDVLCLPTGDVPYDDNAEVGAAPRYESDYAYEKPAADVLVVGSFHAPGDKAVRTGEVAVSVDQRTLRLAVVGRRFWHGSGALPGPKQAEPFSTLPLRWEYAFGGPEHIANPVGSGYVPSGKNLGQMIKPRDFVAQPLELPRIERFEDGMTSVEQILTPVCFAPRARTWPVRAKLLGTTDERWQKTRWPWFPADFDPRYFQAALPELQFANSLRGDEALRFTNMHPSIALYETRLPGLRAIAAVQRIDAVSGELRTEAVPMRLDTLWIDMDAQVAQLVWRGSCVARDANSSDIAYAWADLESVSAQPSDLEITRRAEHGIAHYEAQWVIAEKEPPEPPAPAPPPEPEAEELDPELLAILATLPKASDDPLPELSPEQQAKLAQSLAQAQSEAQARFEAEAENEEPHGPPPWTRERVREAYARKESLAGIDLSGLDLSGEDLSSADLTGTIFNGACLDGASFQAAVMSRASLEATSLNGANLTRAQLDDAVLAKSHGAALVLSDAQLVSANLSACTWLDTQFLRTNLQLAHAMDANFTGAIFDGANLAETNLERSTLEDASFRGIEAGGCRLTNAQLTRAKFVDCKLNESDMSGAGLASASFSGCTLDDVMFENARATELQIVDCSVARLRAAAADMTGATLLRLTGKDPIFEAVQLSKAALTECTLPGADFSAAKLDQARLQGSTFKKAKFGGANLTDAFVVGCDCFETTFEAAQLEGCDGSYSSFFRSEFLDANVSGFVGTERDLRGTKLDARKG